MKFVTLSMEKISMGRIWRAGREEEGSVWEKEGSSVKAGVREGWREMIPVWGSWQTRAWERRMFKSSLSPYFRISTFNVCAKRFFKICFSGIQRVGPTSLLMSSNYNIWGMSGFESRELAMKSSSATNIVPIHAPTNLATLHLLCKEIGF